MARVNIKTILLLLGVFAISATIGKKKGRHGRKHQVSSGTSSSSSVEEAGAGTEAPLFEGDIHDLIDIEGLSEEECADLQQWLIDHYNVTIDLVNLMDNNATGSTSSSSSSSGGSGTGEITMEEWWWSAQDIEDWFASWRQNRTGGNNDNNNGGNGDGDDDDDGELPDVGDGDGGSGETPPDDLEIPVCGVYLNGTIDYSENGANWCDVCMTGDFQSPIMIPEVFIQIFIDLQVDYNWGVLRRAYLDVTKNFVKLKFFSDGFLRLEGTFLNGTDVHKIWRPKGVAEFHTPAEHRFHAGEILDVELEFLMEDHEGNEARVSVFFDRQVGGNESHAFLDNLLLEEPGRESMADVNATVQELFDSFENLSLYMYEGSITYPPCDKPVVWYLFHDVQSISQEQLSLLRSYFRGNNRALQEVSFDQDVTPITQHNLLEKGCGMCC